MLAAGEVYAAAPALVVQGEETLLWPYTYWIRWPVLLFRPACAPMYRSQIGPLSSDKLTNIDMPHGSARRTAKSS